MAVALFASGIRLLARSPKYHRPRGLFCGSGHCASCLLRIDGQPNLRSCLIPARPGLRCDRQNAFPDPELDLLRAADWLFPRGMDHHELLTGNRLANELFVKVVRQMGGSGTLPDQPPDELPAHPGRDGRPLHRGGRSGGARRGARGRGSAGPGSTVLVLDDQDRPGGSLLAEPGGCTRASRDGERRPPRAGARLWASATAIGYFPEDRRDPSGRRWPARAAGREPPGGPVPGVGPAIPVRHGRLRPEPAPARLRSPGGARRARGRAAGLPLGRPSGPPGGDRPPRRARARRIWTGWPAGWPSSGWRSRPARPARCPGSI